MTVMSCLVALLHREGTASLCKSPCSWRNTTPVAAYTQTALPLADVPNVSEAPQIRESTLKPSYISRFGSL